MKIGPKVYGKQESVKSQDFPPDGKISSKMAPVNKKILKVPEIKNKDFSKTQKPVATPTFCKQNFHSRLHTLNPFL